MNAKSPSTVAQPRCERDFGVLARPTTERLGGYGYLGLLQRSLVRLEEQWARGALPAHRACSLKDKREAEGRWLSGDPITRGEVEKPSNNFRCESFSCRPGDPMGCAAANARMKAKQSTFVLTRWLDNDGARVIYGVFDTRGGPDEPLASVMGRASSDFDKLKASDKGNWQQHVETETVAGYLWHLGAFRRQGRWIVRRWVFVGVRGTSTTKDTQRWSQRIKLDWKLRAAGQGGSGSFSGWARARGDRQAEIITRVAAGVTRYELRHAEERDIRQAARTIEAHGVGDRAWRPEEASMDDPWFVEYAKSFGGKPTWQSSRASSSAPEWRAALEDEEFKRIRFSNSHMRRPKKAEVARITGKRKPIEGDIW